MIGTARISTSLATTLLCVAASVAATGAASGCDKKSPSTNNVGGAGVVEAADRAKPAGPIDKTPLDGIDLSKLPEAKHELFYELVGSLSSPCGKPHSLRTSYVTDTECKRAPFAVRYVLELLIDDAKRDIAQNLYNAKYKGPAPVAIKLDDAPRLGPADAPVVIVEYFDYNCGHCQDLHPELNKAEAALGDDLAVIYKMFPLGNWPDSEPAAQAAVAASAQGKFKEMNDMLFAKAPALGRDALWKYAETLGLDMVKFEADFTAAKATVASHRAEGDKLGVDSTPAIFFNGRPFQAPHEAKYLEMWVREEVAVAR